MADGPSKEYVDANANLLREANRLAMAVLEGQSRNYRVMQQLLRMLLLVLVATIGLLIVLVVQVFR
jgi:hypothetical protein